MPVEATAALFDQGMGLMGTIVVEGAQLRAVAQHQRPVRRKFHA